jgi:phosphate transport system substrate-binding protein
LNKRSMGWLAALAGTALASSAGEAAARDQIRIVGSSTVYPFTTTVAERLGRSGATKTPVVEATGTGGGMKIFCEGIGVDKADATNASRRMKKSEFDACQKNGVTGIVEIKIGYDGLTLAQAKAALPMKLTLAQVYLALAEQVPDKDGKLAPNPHKTWSDIDKVLQPFLQGGNHRRRHGGVDLSQHGDQLRDLHGRQLRDIFSIDPAAQRSLAQPRPLA